MSPLARSGSMLPIFESILPVFLLVVLGALLKRWRLIDRDMWNGLEQLGFFVLFPSLLFTTLANAEFSGMAAGTAYGSFGSATTDFVSRINRSRIRPASGP